MLKYSPCQDDINCVVSYLNQNYPGLTKYEDIYIILERDDELKGLLLNIVNANIMEHISEYIENCTYVLLSNAILEKSHEKLQKMSN